MFYIVYFTNMTKLNLKKNIKHCLVLKNNKKMNMK